MKFNINDYRGRYAMHCKTEEEAKIFCHYLNSVGRKWNSGDSYLSMTNWIINESDTCYVFNNRTYSDVPTCERDYTILEFSDFDWDNKECEPFKVGDRVRCINRYYGNGYIVGKVGKVIDVDLYSCGSGEILVEFDSDICGHDGGGKGKRNHCWWIENSSEYLELANTKRKPVIIYQNGQEIVALDKETGERAVAKCHPNDEFDFAIGAKIAFGRLYHSQDYIPESNKAKDISKINVGDRVKVTNPGRAYSSYAEWVTKNAPEFAVYYVYTLYYADIYKKLGTSTFTVVAKAPHTDFADRMLYLVQDEFARCFLFGEEGIEKCD